MHIRKQKRKDGRTYLSVVEGYRTPEDKTRSRYVRSPGYLDELERAYDDPIAHFQAEVDAENEAAGEAAAPIVVEPRPMGRADKRGCHRVEVGAWDRSPTAFVRGLSNRVQ